MFLLKRRNPAIGFLLLFLLFLTGCASLNKAPEKKDMTKYPIYGQEMLQGLQAGSYKDFVKDFSGELLQTIPERAFDQLKRELKKNNDTLKEWKFLTTLDRAGLYRVDLWKVTFVRSSSSGERSIERLFTVTSTRLDGKDQVIGFKFDMLF